MRYNPIPPFPRLRRVLSAVTMIKRAAQTHISRVIRVARQLLGGFWHVQKKRVARRILYEAVYWDWRLKDIDMPLDEWHRFREWHSVAEHREMLDAVEAVAQQDSRLSARS